MNSRDFFRFQPAQKPASSRLLALLTIPFVAGTVFGQAPAGLATVNLNRVHRGSEIVAALGTNLPAVAKGYGLTENALRDLCQRNRDLRADRTGKLFYACEGAVAKAPTATNGGTDALLSYPSTQTFQLHSKPGLSRVLYLDFNGHTTSGTSWNSTYTGGAAFISPSYDTDGNTGAFSSTELANIQEIWKRVSEDFAAWDVDVTTEEPPLESLRKTTNTDPAYGIRMVIGGNSNDLLGAAAGGVAYIGSFSWNSDTPAFVFPAQLGNGYPKYVAEAASHEAGHAVSLNHDGKTDGTEYYAGHSGWAPIMGSGYNATVTQFSRGEYSLANNTQDDLTDINSHIPRSADLAGNDILTAVPLSGTAISVTGIIESRTDADLFKINAGTGTLNLTATPASPDANLDIQLSLYNGAGNLVTSTNPTGLSATLSVAVTPGTYYIAVDGVGVGTGTTGYTDYASIGQFSLTGTVPSSVGQPPVAVVSNSAPLTGLAPLTVQFSSLGSYDPEGSNLTYDWDFGDGTRSTASHPAHLYTLPGTYTASLVVFDSTGLSGSAATTIIVQDSSKLLYVSNIVMSKTTTNRGTQATATVTVKDGTGAVKPNVTVTGKWSGLTTTTSTGKTGSSGQVALSSGLSKGTGTFTFTITGLTLSGSTYQPSLNAVSIGSIMK